MSHCYCSRSSSKEGTWNTVTCTLMKYLTASSPYFIYANIVVQDLLRSLTLPPRLIRYTRFACALHPCSSLRRRRCHIAADAIWLVFTERETAALIIHSVPNCACLLWALGINQQRCIAAISWALNPILESFKRFRSALMVCSHPNSDFLDEQSHPDDNEDLRFKGSVFLSTMYIYN